MTDNVQRVRIDRLVLRGVDMDLHDAASLPARIAAELDRPRRGDASDPALATTTHDVALSVANRIITEVRSRGHER